jgi:phage terminase small subunit
MPALTNPKYERFAQLISEGKSGTEAYIAAGHEVSRKTAGVNASRLLKNPEVKARVEELVAQRAEIEAKATEKAITTAVETLAVTKERVIGELAKLGFSNMLDYMTVNNDGRAYCDLSALTRDQAAAIQEVTFETIMSSSPDAIDAAESMGLVEPDGKDKKSVAVLKTRFKLADKRAALVDLGKYLGIFEADNRQRGEAQGEAMAKALSDIEFARWLAFKLASAADKAIPLPAE